MTVIPGWVLLPDINKISHTRGSTHSLHSGKGGILCVVLSVLFEKVDCIVGPQEVASCPSCFQIPVCVWVCVCVCWGGRLCGGAKRGEGLDFVPKLLGRCADTILRGLPDQKCRHGNPTSFTVLSPLLCNQVDLGTCLVVPWMWNLAPQTTTGKQEMLQISPGEWDRICHICRVFWWYGTGYATSVEY